MLGTSFPSSALVKRELIGTLRRPVSFVFLCIVVGGMASVLILSWPEKSVNLTQAGMLSSRVFFIAYVSMHIACLLFIPGIAAASVTAEKESESLDLLRITLIGPGGIVLGKLVSAMGFLVLLMVAVLPVISATLFLVGIELTELTWGFLDVLASGLFYASVGVLCSVLCKKTSRAVVTAYALLFVLWTFPNVLGLLFYVGTGASLLTRCILAGICMLIAWRAFGQRAKHDAFETRKPIDDPATLAARRKRFPYYLIDPLKRKKSIGDGRNPVFVSEIRWGPRGNPVSMVRMFYVSMIILATVSILVSIRGEFSRTRSLDDLAYMLAIHCLFAALVCPAMLANALTRERETGGLDLLRLTLLTPREIVTGKLVAGLVAMTPFFAASAYASLLYVAISSGLSQGVVFCLVEGYVTLAACIFMALTLGLVASSDSRQTVGSVVGSYFLTFLVFVGFPFGINAFIQWFYSPFGYGVLWVSSPVLAFLEFRTRHLYHSTPIDEWIISLAIYAVLGTGLIALSVNRFAHSFKWER